MKRSITDKLTTPLLFVAGGFLGVAAVTALSLRAADVLAKLLADLAAAALRMVLL